MELIRFIGLLAVMSMVFYAPLFSVMIVVAYLLSIKEKD
jgi:hypothetical protein